MVLVTVSHRLEVQILFKKFDLYFEKKIQQLQLQFILITRQVWYTNLKLVTSRIKYEIRAFVN